MPRGGLVPERLVIIGAGGFGREAADVVEALNSATREPPWELVGIVDDGLSEINAERLRSRSLAYLGTVDDLLQRLERPHYVIGIGAPAVRKRIATRLDGRGFAAATLIHPAATLGSEVCVGAGSVICAGSRITTNVTVGRHVHVNPNCTVGHDSRLDDYVSMNPASSVSGECVVETGALIGVSATVLNQLTVGAAAVVGGGACVVRDVPGGVTVKGVPAR